MTVLFNFRHFCSGAALAIATLAAVVACAKPSADIVDNTGPTVAGPITGGSKGWIYRSPVLDPEALGYVIEEYFISGDAHSYRFAEGAEAQFDGAWSTEIDETAPFTTRIFVLRPSDPQDYNGVLLAHWQNVSAGYENGWPSGDEIFSGYLADGCVGAVQWNLWHACQPSLFASGMGRRAVWLAGTCWRCVFI